MRKKNTYKSEEAYRAAKARQSMRYRHRTGSGLYHSHWSDDELLAIMRHEQPDSQLANQIHHSVSAIQAARRRVRMGEVRIPGYDPSMDALAPLSKHAQRKENPSMKQTRYLVFVKSEYIRDAQAYVGAPCEDDPIEVDKGWLDANGPMLVLDIHANDVKAVKDRITRVYPDADMDVFEILNVDAKEVDLS